MGKSKQPKIQRNKTTQVGLFYNAPEPTRLSIHVRHRCHNSTSNGVLYLGLAPPRPL